MKESLFQELIASVKEGGAILRGEQKPSRVFKVEITYGKPLKVKIKRITPR